MHTPTPWKHDGHGEVRAGDEFVAHCYRYPDGRHLANAAHLVICVNAHDELLAALNEIACWSSGPSVNSGFDEPAAAKIARDALAEVDPC